MTSSKSYLDIFQVIGSIEQHGNTVQVDFLFCDLRNYTKDCTKNENWTPLPIGSHPQMGEDLYTTLYQDWTDSGLDIFSRFPLTHIKLG